MRTSRFNDSTGERWMVSSHCGLLVAERTAVLALTPFFPICTLTYADGLSPFEVCRCLAPRTTTTSSRGIIAPVWSSTVGDSRPRRRSWTRTCCECVALSINACAALEDALIAALAAKTPWSKAAPPADLTRSKGFWRTTSSTTRHTALFTTSSIVRPSRCGGGGGCARPSLRRRAGRGFSSRCCSSTVRIWIALCLAWTAAAVFEAPRNASAYKLTSRIQTRRTSSSRPSCTAGASAALGGPVFGGPVATSHSSNSATSTSSHSSKSSVACACCDVASLASNSTSVHPSAAQTLRPCLAWRSRWMVMPSASTLRTSTAALPPRRYEYSEAGLRRTDMRLILKKKGVSLNLCGFAQTTGPTVTVSSVTPQCTATHLIRQPKLPGGMSRKTTFSRTLVATKPRM
mmetsp:Transcript_16523/g.55782  ORF Transcript_16523/g.55782 Transcript_16523/m.55782 type:complete len:403 (+) Transcript_16523:311-1519(+)